MYEWFFACLALSFLRGMIQTVSSLCATKRSSVVSWVMNEWLKKTDFDWVIIWSQASCRAYLPWMWCHLSFYLQILFTHFSNLTLSNKSLEYYCGALFGVSLPLFRPKLRQNAINFWLLQALDLNEEKWGPCLLWPVLHLLWLVCICVWQRDDGTGQLQPTEPPCLGETQSGWQSPGH